MGRPTRAAAEALGAAALFGVSVPLAKRLAPDVGPLMLAALLYLGAGLSLAALRAVRRQAAEAPLRRADLPALAGLVLAGGAVAPALLLFGLRRSSGMAASLLLNLEAPLTALLAVALFGEQIGRRALLG